MQRITVLLVALLGLASPLSAQDNPLPRPRRAFTTASVRVHDGPSPTARTIGILPRATLVTVGDCDETWCAVNVARLDGFAARRYLAFSRPIASPEAESTATTQQQASPQAQQQGRGYINSRGEWVPSPQRSPDGRVPAGASAQCRDGTYSFSKSRSGTCSHHGGVARWL